MNSRTTIRAAFAAQLTGLHTTGARVYTSRTRQINDADLPCILVFSGESTVEESEYGMPTPVTLTYQLRADILVKSSLGSENTADQVLSEILASLFASESANTLQGTVDTLSLLQIGAPEMDPSIDQPVVRLPVLFATRLIY